MLVEAKGAVTREALRMAIGQLADYSRFLPESIRVVLVPEEPRADPLALVESVGVTVVWPSGASYEGSARPALVNGSVTTASSPEPRARSRRTVLGLPLAVASLAARVRTEGSS